MNVKLTNHFSLCEFAISSRFPSLAAMISFQPIEIERIRFACASILEPFRRMIGEPVSILSGKRSEELNKAIGGKEYSHHLFTADTGAVDCSVGALKPVEAAHWLVSNCQVAYVVAYPHRNFIHISFPNSSERCNELLIDDSRQEFTEPYSKEQNND